MDPSEASTGQAPTIYESDSDSVIEHELVRALFSNGKKRKDQGDLVGAERHLRNCLSRFPSTASYTTLASSQSTLSTGVSKAELLEMLTETYCLQGNWADAKSTMKEKLAITERQTGKKSEHFLWDSFRLCEVLMNTKDYTEAQLHGRQALRGFRKLRGHGHTGYEKTLALLVQICNEQGNLEDEEAYAALLSSHQIIQETTLPGAEVSLNMKQSHTDSPLRLKEDALTPGEYTKNDHILGLECSTPNKPEPADKGKQPLVRELTPIPPIATRDDSTPLSPSSSTSIEPSWSPTRHTAQIRRPSLLLAGTAQEVISILANSRQREIPTGDGLAKQEATKTARDANADVVASSTKLLIDLCQQELRGEKPVFMIGRGRQGYNCIVFADSTRQKTLAKVVDCSTKEEARYAAATAAYKALVSTSLSSPKASSPRRLTHNESQIEPSVSPSTRDHNTLVSSNRIDPPPYMDPENPSSLTSSTGFLPDIPEIMLSPVITDAAIARPIPSASAQVFPVRRAASDSRLPQHKVSSSAHTPTFGPSREILPLRPSDLNLGSGLPAHRRAASTSSRLPASRAENIKATERSLGLAIRSSTLEEARSAGEIPKKVQPNVTFDAIESSVQRPDHSNPDATTPSSKTFSLFPSSLAKTLSLQNGRSKSDDTTLTKKKSLRFGFSSKRKSSTSGLAESQSPSDAEAATSMCPICFTKLQGLNDGEKRSHVDNCLGRPSPLADGNTFELPASEPSLYPIELPASMPTPGVTDLSDLHRAFSKRDLSADKFENESDVGPVSFSLESAQRAPKRQILLLGDPGCGKTWLSSAFCDGSIPKHTHTTAMTFRRHLGHCGVVIQDYSGFHHATEKLRRASYGMVDVVLLCFDISSPDSFENVEHKWNHEADLYLKKVPKILVGCKKDVNPTGTHTVWTRDAYRLTAKINARAYFETSAVTTEGLEELFNHLSQITRRS
ncbi:hypothetical protein E8E13_004417 [Curvularia kusanoi]|uniref:Uncharacterized protein n=1 Tax=Curvularia kusanoi TaxID=90978 RepID=A0A9P4TBH3_CURKU|nr:hypothetical protein E8E13_004417 [Curvularia kusanoi]